jgi:hypothetical protein
LGRVGKSDAYNLNFYILTFNIFNLGKTIVPGAEDVKGKNELKDQSP